MIREELSASAKIEVHRQAPSTVQEDVPVQPDPLLPTPLEHRLLPRKKGWWASKPPRKLDEPLEPLHPAVQISLMAVAVVGSSILMQLILF